MNKPDSRPVFCQATNACFGMPEVKDGEKWVCDLHYRGIRPIPPTNDSAKILKRSM